MSTVAEVLQTQIGMPVTGLQVRVQSASQLYQGTSNGRNWSKMILNCADNTGSIEVAWWNGDVADPKAMENELVTINARTHKGNLVGALLKTNRAGATEISCNDTCLSHPGVTGAAIPAPAQVQAPATPTVPYAQAAAQPVAASRASVPPPRKSVHTDEEIFGHITKWFKRLKKISPKQEWGATLNTMLIGLQRGDIIPAPIKEVKPKDTGEANDAKTAETAEANDDGGVPF